LHNILKRKDPKMIGRKLIPNVISLVLIILLMVGCRANVASPSPSLYPTLTISPTAVIASSTPEKISHSLLIPVGRTAVVGGNTFQVMVDSELFDAQPSYDGYGGYWINVPFNPKNNSKVLLRFDISNEKNGLYREEDNDREKWVKPSALIDSNDPILVEKAKQLSVGADTTIEKARKIHEFVIGFLKFQPYGRHYLSSASETYQMGFGTCVNFARLFVALSRAANVPARTVWGATFNNGAYEHHHEWAEFLDDDGFWHPLDLSYTTSFNLSDVNYLDLIYSSEENPLYEQSRTEQYSKNMSRYIVYDTTSEPYDGRLGFSIIENNYPISYVVENVFVLANLPNMVPQLVP
jgi:hypothetical protein